jgi:hypothetical protein
VGISYHSAYAPDGAALNLFDRVVIGTVTATYGAGVSTGASVVTTLTWTEPVASTYTIIVSPIEDSTSFFTAKTQLSAVMTMNSRLATGTLTGGPVEVLILT